MGILKTAKTLGIGIGTGTGTGTGTAQRIKEEMSSPFDASAGVEMFSTI